MDISVVIVLLFVLRATCDALRADDDGLIGVSPLLNNEDYEKYLKEEVLNIYNDQKQPLNTTCHKRTCHSEIWKACSRTVSRLGWHAKASKSSSLISTPVNIVFIHHTVTARCQASRQCQQIVQQVQDYHVFNKGWDDIGYSFVVGEDGWAYEGRGYNRVGAHTLGYNNISISIAVIGDFSNDLPNGPALEAINSVIECGILQGKISPDYKLYGHCDARPMFESPGKKLYALIKTWPHYGHTVPVEILKASLNH